MAEIRVFTKEDWYAWGGATAFKNNDPLIYEQELNGGAVQLTMIGDATGISIYMSEDGNDDPSLMEWSWSKELNNHIKIEGEMRAMIKEFELEDKPYAPDVSYQLDHCSKWNFDYLEV